MVCNYLIVCADLGKVKVFYGGLKKKCRFVSVNVNYVVFMKLLFMLSRVPYPLIKGDKLRAYYHIKELSKYHDIILCALSDEPVHKEAVEELEKYCKSIHIFKLKWYKIIFNIFLALIKGKPLQTGYFNDKQIKKNVDEIIRKEKVEHIFCQLIRVADYVKHHKIPKTLDYQDVFSKGIERRKKKVSFLLKPIFNMEYKRLEKYETEVFAYFTHRIIISEADREHIQHKEKEKIHVIPNGVDQSYFKPQKRDKKYDLLFTGNMAYPPNIHAATYLITEILPLLKSEFPNINILIAGACPVNKIRKMESTQVIVTGYVKDIRRCYEESRIFVAPMQLGTGLQNKLLEAMAMQLPCVSSVLANNALGASNGKEILLGETATDYVSHIKKLLQNENYTKEIAVAGYDFVSRNFNWEKLTLKIDEMIGR